MAYMLNANSMWSKSDACESFTGITHISENISRCCYQQRNVKYSLHIVHLVKYINTKSKKVNFKNMKKLTTKTIICCTPCFYLMPLAFLKTCLLKHLTRSGKYP